MLVRMTISGPQEPDITSLLQILADAVGPDVPVDVYFVERHRLTTTTSTVADAVGTSPTR